MYIYCLSTARASLRSLYIICSLICGTNKSFNGQVPYVNLLVPRQVCFAISTPLVENFQNSEL